MSPAFSGSLKIWIALILVLSLFAFAAPARAQDDLVPNPAAEAYVVQQINDGAAADLADRFENEADRVIGADFLSRVLRQNESGMRMQDWGLDLRNATVVGEVLEYNVAVPFEVYFQSVYFTNRVFLNQFNFQKQVTFWECEFNDKVDLSYSNFGYSLSFTNSIFNGPVNLYLLNVARSFYASGTTFNSDLAMIGSRIERELNFEDSHFTATDGIADFDGITVGWKAFFRRAIFDGSANFYAGNYHFLFAAGDAQFTNPDAWVDFSNARFAHVAFLDGITVAGTADFVNTSAWIVQLSDAYFTSPTANVTFAMQAEEAYIMNTEFSGPVDWTDMEVSEMLNLSGSKFLSADSPIIARAWHVGAANLSGTTFANTVDFSDSIFTEAVDMSSAQFDGQLIMSEVSIADGLNLDDAAFNRALPEGLAVDDSEAQAARLDYLSVASALSMRNTTIMGPVDLSYMQAGHFFLEPNAEASGTIARVDLGQVKIEGQFSIKNLTVNQLNADSLTVAGPLNVDGLSIAESANLRNSDFTYVGLNSVTWPQTANTLTLDSMNYTYISVTQKESANTIETWRDALSFINNANFSLDVYKKLESFFTEQGEVEAANAVFIAMRDRQAEQYSWAQPQRWWYLFMKLFILYGRGPQIAALWSALFIAIGAFIFRKKAGMIPADLSDPEAHYFSPVWYSFDAFIPYIDLNMNTNWRPKAERKFANTYLRFHNIMGWVLIPIAVLAISGVI